MTFLPAQKVQKSPPMLMIFHLGKSQKGFRTWPNKKNCLEGSKKWKKVPIVAKLKTKDVAVLSHNQSCN